MCSLTSPSCAGIQNRMLGGVAVEGEQRLPNTDFSSQDTNSDIDSKIMQLELKRARLEAQITLSKTQTMLAEMELHLVEIELRHELWRHRSEAHIQPPAKSQTKRPYRRLLVRKQIRPTVRPHYRKPKSCTQDKPNETTDVIVNVEKNEQLTDGSHPVDDQRHQKQVVGSGQTTQGEVVTNDLKLDASQLNPQKIAENPHLNAWIDPQDAVLIANSRDDTDAKHAGQTDLFTEINKTLIETEIVQDYIIGKDKDKNQYVSRKDHKSDDSKAKTIKKVKRQTHEKTASSNTCVHKDEEAENNNIDMHETNTEASSARSQKSEKKSSTNEKHTAVKNNSDIKKNSNKICSVTMVRLNDNVSLEVNNNDVNKQNSETDGVDAVDTTISQIKDIESTPRVKRTLSGTKEVNNVNAIERTKTGDVNNIAQKLPSTCVKVVHKEQNTIKKYSNEKKQSQNKNVQDKENLSYVSKERHRSRDSKTESSNKDKKYESKRTTSTSNNNNRHKSNADKSHDKSRRIKNTSSHRHHKDGNDANKGNAKNKENQTKVCFDRTEVDECNKIKSKSSSVEKTTVMRTSSGSEGAKTAVGDKETENNDKCMLGWETDALDSKSNILDKTTQELQDMGNNLLFRELRNCTVKKERSLSLSSLETLKLYRDY